MKALIRQDKEVITETDCIEGIDWNTGAPLTSPTWYGGPYKLVEDFTPEIEPEISGDSTD